MHLTQKIEKLEKELSEIKDYISKNKEQDEPLFVLVDKRFNAKIITQKNGFFIENILI